jgi:chemotaxis protein MotA
MKLLLGIIVINFAFYKAAIFLNQGLSNFSDEVAFVVVILGVFAVSIMTSPSLKAKQIIFHILSAFRSNSGKREDSINNGVNILMGKHPNPKKISRIDQKILMDGIELVKLNFSEEKIQTVLESRINKFLDDGMAMTGWIKSLGKYPPAFGLAGTVLGLIHMMRGLAESSDPKETGLRMSIALLATLYGIILSNMIILPLSERMKSNIIEDVNLCEISLNAIMLYKRKANIIEAQENLNAFVFSENKKLDLLTPLMEAS